MQQKLSAHQHFDEQYDESNNEEPVTPIEAQEWPDPWKFKIESFYSESSDSETEIDREETSQQHQQQKRANSTTTNRRDLVREEYARIQLVERDRELRDTHQIPQAPPLVSKAITISIAIPGSALRQFQSSQTNFVMEHIARAVRLFRVSEIIIYLDEDPKWKADAPKLVTLAREKLSKYCKQHGTSVETFRQVGSLSAVFAGGPHAEDGGYDISIGISRFGAPFIDNLRSQAQFKHILLVFEGNRGFGCAIKNDPTIAEKRPVQIFDKILTPCPYSGSTSLQINEAVFISLTELQSYLPRI